MDDEAPPNGGLDARGGQRRPRWGRRTPYGLRRDSRGDGWHEPADGRSDATYAALDLGTNNCRLLIARPAGDGFRVVDAFSRIIRLGEGVAASRRISEAAIERAVEALQVCRDKMHARGVVRARLIATEACRAAENGETFRKRVAEQAGLRQGYIADIEAGKKTGSATSLKAIAAALGVQGTDERLLRGVPGDLGEVRAARAPPARGGRLVLADGHVCSSSYCWAG